MIRRAIVAAALVLATVPAVAAPIAVDGGQIDGVAPRSGVVAWLGIPFAAPPTGDRRWQPPRPVEKWTGVRHADRFAPECLQPLRGSRQNHYFGVEASSEDCLYLDVWAPDRARRAPVIV